MKFFNHFSCLVVLLLSLSSCSLFGLDYLDSESFDDTKPDNQINMTVWDFLNSRPDIFSSLIDGIKYAGIENLYKEPGNTHVLLTNAALSSGSNSFWFKNKVLIPGETEPAMAEAWEQYDKNVVKELLTYHILKGEWSFFNLTSSANWVKTYGEGSFDYVKNGQTLKGDTAVIDIKVGFDRTLPLQLNNYSWNFRVLTIAQGSCRTTNIKATNGFIHVSDWYQPRPTRKFMNQD